MAVQKRLGELLLDAGLITAEQLQTAITHQKIAKGRLGSNLVALGYISEDTLMDFLGQQMKVDKVDVRHMDIPLDLLRRIPKRMAEQYMVLPVGLKEPKTLILAMADPMDLNAVDSARFATGLHIETVVAAHSAMKTAISDQYRKINDAEPTTFTVGSLDEGLPVNFNFEPMEIKASLPAAGRSTGKQPLPAFPSDPFFDEVQKQAQAQNGVTIPLDHLDELPDLDFTLLSNPAPTTPANAAAPMATSPSGILPGRTTGLGALRLDGYKDRALMMGLIKVLMRRGIFTMDDLQRTLANMVEAGEVGEDRERSGF